MGSSRIWKNNVHHPTENSSIVNENGEKKLKVPDMGELHCKFCLALPNNYTAVRECNEKEGIERELREGLQLYKCKLGYLPWKNLLREGFEDFKDPNLANLRESEEEFEPLLKKVRGIVHQ